MQKFKKISYWIFNALLIFVLVVLIFMVVGNISLNIQKRKGEKTPNVLGFAPISVADNFMSPEINENDLLIIQMTGELQVGDVITYLLPNNKDYQTQRIAQIVYSENGQYVKQYIVENAQGDKSVVLPTYVYGKVSIRLAGFAPVIAFFNTVPGTSLLIALALLVIFLPDIIAVFARDKKEKNEKKNSDGGKGENEQISEKAEQTAESIEIVNPNKEN